jgi:hypothetical protein
MPIDKERTREYAAVMPPGIESITYSGNPTEESAT